MSLDSLLVWITSNWFTVIEVIGSIAAIASLPTAYWVSRKPRWHKYRCRQLPYGMIFRGSEYGYDSKTFLNDVGSVDDALKSLRAWNVEGAKPLLVRGVTGSGKSRLITEFIGGLNWRYRLWRRILMPTPHELSEMAPPYFTRACILFLNDLHEFRDSVPDADAKLKYCIQTKKFKSVATIPNEKYDPNWGVLSKFIWDEISLADWTIEEGKKLAEITKKEFEPESFTGTPLSVLAPEAELKRSYELLSPGGKGVLRALKIIKIHLGCPAGYDLISSLQSTESKFDHSDFLDIVSKQGFWCKTYDSKCMLADGLEEFIPYPVSMDDAFRLQTILFGEE
ncbi:MAG: hypothetical protein ACLP5V_07595 [Candidatus Bathyarchaeia archaeon]